MFFDGWSGVGRVLLIGVLAYVALLLILRVTGKRTLSKLNAFDLVVTVALGSTLSSVLLDDSIALAEGVTAFSVLILAQYVVTWLSVRVPLVQRVVKAEPRLLLHRGAPLRDAMRRERVTYAELEAAARGSGVADLASVLAIVLETDGSLHVVTSDAPDTDDRTHTLRGLQGGPEPSESPPRTQGLPHAN